MPRQPRALGRRAGVTLVELLIAIALFAVLAIKASVIMRVARSTDHSSALVVQHQANLVLDRIAIAVLGSDRGTLIPQFENPVHTDTLRYNVSLGVENGEVVWGDPEEITLEGDSQVVWRESPGEADERRAVWSKIARPLLEGELQNGIDDNGNGLVDESGLTFTLLRNSVTIRLTLGVDGSDGQSEVRTVETVITIRNQEGMGS